MDERRDKQPQAEPGPPIAAPPPLTPKQAHDAYKAHANPKECRQCADVDRRRCEAGERMWQDWTDACNAAFEELRGGTG